MGLFDHFRSKKPSTTTASQGVTGNSKEMGVTKMEDMKKRGMLVNNFGFKLMGNIISDDDKGNVMVAPGSVWDILRILRSGASESGVVEKELDGVIGGGDVGGMLGKGEEGGEEGVVVRKANGVFVRGDVRDSWKGVVGAMGGVVGGLESAGGINKWVKGVTEGNIEEVVKVVDGNTICVAVNAVYFKGIWDTVFEEKETVDGEFMKGDGTKKTVRFMKRHSKNMRYADWQIGEKKSLAQGIELPYGENHQYSAVFIVSRGIPVSDLVKQLDKGGQKVWDHWMNQFHSREVSLSLPKFKIEYGVRSLVKDLKKMGMQAAFDNRNDGMFLKMSDRKDVFISDIAHKTVVEVNEQGTKAAGATVATIMTRSLPPPLVNLAVNEPFLFAIRNRKSSELLFIGRVEDP